MTSAINNKNIIRTDKGGYEYYALVNNIKPQGHKVLHQIIYLRAEMIMSKKFVTWHHVWQSYLMYVCIYLRKSTYDM